MTSDLDPSRRETLLADAVFGWVDEADREELEALLRDPQAQREYEELERAAAVAGAVADTPAAERDVDAMLALAAKLHADAGAHFAAMRAEAARARLHPLRVLPWLLAAASIVLAMWPQMPPTPIEPGFARAALLQQPASQWVRWDWQPGPSPRRGEVQGDVVWAVGSDEGYLRLRGLPQLDVGHRYQLWIVDGSRQGPPIDGGLLPSLRGDGEVVVRMAAHLPVLREAGFVLTIENADGVVVSAQEHVVAIAKP